MSGFQSLPDARQQSFEEIYGPPENFLEIEVRCDTFSPRSSAPRIKHACTLSLTPPHKSLVLC